jgi:hypothetical protein|tara:strand:- start:384 stop:779 length:396 start_codon:yes stop_codon:yes gene_type:complete
MADSAKIAWDKLNVKERKLFSIVILVTILLSVILGLSYGNIIVMLNLLVMTITVTFVSVEIYVNFIRSRKSLKNEAYNSDAKFTCPYCSQRVEVPNSLFGQMISCPTCEKDFRASGIAERDGRTVTVRKNS